MNDSTLVRHGPCPDCDSSDALGVYDDGHTKCYSCDKFTPAKDVQSPADMVREANARQGGAPMIDSVPADLVARKIHLATCRKWGYGIGTYKGASVHVATYKDDDGNPVAQKIRTADKKFVIFGDAKAMGLYGKWLWRDGGRKVVVVEGELDALSMSQLQQLKWPVVSVPNGAQSAAKAVKKDLAWLEAFEQVIFMFDQDAPGRDAATECALLLTPGKACIATLPEGIKDANEGLVAGRGDEVIDAFWSAKTYRPDGIVTVADAVQRLKESSAMVPIARCRVFPGLDAKTRGYYRGQVWMICAGSGMGKTEFAREMEVDMLQQGLKVGHIGLEETIDRSVAGVVGTMVDARLYLDPDPMSHPKWEESTAWLEDKLFLYDHWGSTEGDHLLSKMRYMHVALGCEVVVLDHLSIVVSDLDSEQDERRTIDRLMSKLKAFASETGCLVICVSHLKRPKDKPHEEGGRTALGQLRGSAAIGQLSNICVGLERDQQSPEHSNIATIRILKNRKAGETGIAGYLAFDTTTGRMHDCPAPTQTAASHGFPVETGDF